MKTEATFSGQDGTVRAFRGARRLILGGFALIVVSVILDVVNNYTSGSYRFMFASGQINLYLIVLSSMSSFMAWCYLSALDVVGKSQQRLVTKALLYFGLGMLFELIINFNWTHLVSLVSLEGVLRWTLMVGEASAAMGFLWSSARMKSRTGVDELVESR